MSTPRDARAAVAAGDPAGLATGGQEARHEVKFAAYATEYHRVRQWLLMHPMGFVSPYPARRVNNVYFDTWDYQAYSENLAGISERSKLRYRWYGDSPGPAPGALEVKRKRNFFGWKLRFAVTEAPWEPGRTWRAVREAIREQLPPQGRLWFDRNPLPVMLNRYEREYFVTSDGRIRATIDTRQQAFDQRYRSLPNFDRLAVMQDTLVVEFKFARPDRQQAVELLADVPLRIGRHSKYMNALRAVGFV